MAADILHTTQNKYGQVSLEAIELYKTGTPLPEAWHLAAIKIFSQKQQASIEKGCPKSAFLGLASAGKIKGIPKGNYTKSEDNKNYALTALEIITNNPLLASDAKLLWKIVMNGVEKSHNQQMNVVITLWNAKKFSHQ